MNGPTEHARSLEAMGLDELRAQWRLRIGRPPKVRSAGLLRRLLGWHVQAQAYGGIDVATRRSLRSTSTAAKRTLQPGTSITREWQGRPHTVQVQADGLWYESERYPSLSAVARKITGVRWNGPRFFGLRPQGQEE